jgi:hypothetical protein
MSRQGLIAAQHHAAVLPAFRSLAEAKFALLHRKDSILAAFVSACGVDLELDFSPESLKHLEAWYFRIGSPETVAGISLPSAIGFYFGEVLVRNTPFEWVIESFVFEPSKFEIGVARPGYSIMLTAGMLPSKRGNKRKQSLWREWRRIAL